MDEKASGYDEGDIVMITYKPPFYTFEKCLDWACEDDINSSEKVIFNKLKKVIKDVRENHYIARMECGKGGNFHLHVLYCIKDIREYNLWMCYVRQKLCKNEHSLDFRKVTNLKGAVDYINKNSLYPLVKQPLVDNLIDKALDKE